MERWQGRVAVVTGASSGIGAAICRDLVQYGVTTVGLARREDRLLALKEELKGSKGKFHYVKTDLTKENEIVMAFDKIKKNIGGVDILINNAGIAIPTFVKDCEVDKWQTMFGLNVFAVGICSREALKSMKARSVDDGHIINVSSIAAHRVSTNMPAGVYCASKTALKFLTESLRRELVNVKSKIKITHLSPGFVETELIPAGGWQMSYEDVPHMQPVEMANAVRYILETPTGTQALSEELKGSKGKFHYLKVNLLKEDQIVSAFDKIKKDIGGVDIMINNAGLGIQTLAKDGEMDKWETMYKLNVFAVGICTREALNSMKERGVDDGHIINVSSMAAHRLSALPGCGVYSSTKAALRFLSEAVRRELVNDKSKIKITHLSPGAIKTEIFEAGGWKNMSFDKIPHIEPVQIARAVRYILDTPPDTQVDELTVRAVGEGI